MPNYRRFGLLAALLVMPSLQAYADGAETAADVRCVVVGMKFAGMIN